MTMQLAEVPDEVATNLGRTALHEWCLRKMAGIIGTKPTYASLGAHYVCCDAMADQTRTTLASPLIQSATAMTPGQSRAVWLWTLPALMPMAFIWLFPSPSASPAGSGPQTSSPTTQTPTLVVGILVFCAIYAVLARWMSTRIPAISQNAGKLGTFTSPVVQNLAATLERCPRHWYILYVSFMSLPLLVGLANAVKSLESILQFVASGVFAAQWLAVWFVCPFLETRIGPFVTNQRPPTTRRRVIAISAWTACLIPALSAAIIPVALVLTDVLGRGVRSNEWGIAGWSLLLSAVLIALNLLWTRWLINRLRKSCDARHICFQCGSLIRRSGRGQCAACGQSSPWRSPDSCPGCSYNLVGITSVHCPECGTDI